MVKKALIFLIFLILPVSLAISAHAVTIEGIRSYYSPGDVVRVVYTVETERGVVRIKVAGSQKSVSIRIAKDGMEYLHHIASDETVEIPLTMGSGEYELAVRLYITAIAGELLWEDTLTVQMEDELAPYRSASRIVNWNETMELAVQAKSMVSEGNQTKTALAICKFLVENFAYEETIPPPSYIPDLEQVYRNRKGICYDFAALYTAMCRAVGIPAQLVMGYSDYMKPDSYHAWCRVYVDNEWVSIDPTYSIAIQEAVFLDDLRLTSQKAY